VRGTRRTFWAHGVRRASNVTLQVRLAFADSLISLVDRLMDSSAPRSSDSASLPIAVIGGGATGLAAAYQLSKAGRKVRLFESNDRLGGAVRSESVEGWLIEAGPNSFQENSKVVVELIRELGLDSERVVANTAAKKRFVVRGGRPCPIPMSPGSLISTPLFSAGTKARLMAELFSAKRRRTTDVGLADFVRDHFGQEIVDYALNPFVSGIYAGDPRKLSTKYAFPKLWEAEQQKGSLIRGFIAQAKARKAAGEPKSRIISFRNGLGTLINALSEHLPAGAVELGARIEALIPGDPWRIIWKRGTETATESFAAVLLAIPALALSKLSFGALAERPFATLDAIEYPSVASLFLGFRREHVQHPLDGFGALVPSIERMNLLGVLFSSTLFPNRAPAGHVALTVMVGGSNNPALAGKSLDEISEVVLPDLDRLLGLKGQPEFRRLHVWPRAIPQYQLGYERHLEAINTAEAQYRGLHVAGNVRDGIALPSCLQSGLARAEKLLSTRV
jgi:protoporphyrinogen/coproporphyrinogen III oxidase